MGNDPNEVTADELRVAVARSGGYVIERMGDHVDAPAMSQFQNGWQAARFLHELGKIDYKKPAVVAAARELRRGVERSDTAYAARVQSFVKRAVDFQREHGEIFQSPTYSINCGYGDCDDHARLTLALLRAGGVRANFGFLYQPGRGPRHVATIAHLPGGSAWLETTVDAELGEDPMGAATRLGVARADIGKKAKVVILNDDDRFVGPGDLTAFLGSAEPEGDHMGEFAGTTRINVQRALVPFLTHFEGAVPFMYLDDHQPNPLVTTGIGNLIDPVGLALALPWKKPDGSLATPSEIIQTWQLVKSRTDLAPRGGVIFGSIPGNVLRLDQSDIADLVATKLSQNESIFKRFFPSYDEQPADAQLGIHSMSWAAGAAVFGKFPAFTRAINQGDYLTAAEQSHLSGGAPARNQINHDLFVAADGPGRSDPDNIHVPIPGGGSFVNVSPVGGLGGSRNLVVWGLLLAGASYLAYTVNPRLLPQAERQARAAWSAVKRVV